jgi:hypothetical protein
MTLEQLARLIERLLKRSGAAEIGGLGVFSRDKTGDVSFQRSSEGLRIFIAHTTEDDDAAERLFDGLAARGFAPWLDRRKLLPGQNWRRRIEDAIASADFFIACFSTRSVLKRGGFQAEVRFALACANRVPLDDVFVVPVRLDNCRMPSRIQREVQYVDLFPDWDAGFERIVQIIEERQFLRAA